MIFNIIKKRYISYIPLVLLSSLLFLASCTNDWQNESSEVVAPAQSYPEHTDEAAAISQNTEEAAAPDQSYPEYTEEAAAPDQSYPEHTDEAAAISQNTEEAAAPDQSYPEYTEEAADPAESYPEYAEEAVAPAESYPKYAEDTNRIEEYSVVLGADETIKIPGIPGELRVWIGSQNYEPDFPDRMIQDKASVPAVGESATVQPFAPAFKIDPIETQCIKIHPSGSEVRFKLIPQKQGEFEVGANVYLFDSLDCSGAPIPKTASTLKVLVEVNQKDIFIEKANELWNVLWEKFVEFWTALVAIFFGVILFLIRGKLKKWFGYEDD